MDNKNNGVMTKIWGPPGWIFLHSITFGYPYIIEENNAEHIEKKNDYKYLFNSIGKVFPCKYCRDSYNEYIKEIPIDKYLKSRANLCKWLYIIHNKVNAKLGVPKCNIPSFKQVQNKYETFRAKCKKTTATDRNNSLKAKCNSNDIKGCVIPKDGIYKKCIVTILNDENEYILVINLNIVLFVTLTVLLLFSIMYYTKNYKHYK